MIARALAASVAALALLAAAPAPRLDAVPANAQTATLRRYLDAIAARRYDAAFALLHPGAQRYFRRAANFASVFAADGLQLRAYVLTGTRGDAAFRLYFAREQLRLTDPAADTAGSADVTVPYGVIGSGAHARVKDLGHPWRAFASGAAASASNLRVTVKKVSLYEHAVALVVTFTNTGPGFVTALPHGRSVLRAADGSVYRIVAHPPDRQLALGLRLAANSRYTGVLAFATPLLDDRAQRFTLSEGPNLRDGDERPFTVDVAGIAAER